jgi:hypothetical protein
MHDVRAIARTLGGDVLGRDSVVCPGPVNRRGVFIRGPVGSARQRGPGFFFVTEIESSGLSDYFNEPDDPFKSDGYGPLCKITTGG